MTCGPSAQAGGDADPGGVYGSAGVSYKAAASPVILGLSGTTKDASSGDNILIGQHCTASLTGIPSASGITYHWSVSGTTFQTWSADTPTVGGSPYNGDASYYVDGPGDLTLAQPGWYWNDLGEPKTPETVGCTATVTPPAGQGSAFTVTAQKDVTVWRPALTARGTGGEMRVVPVSNGSSIQYLLAAVPTSGSGETGGMDFRATISSPAPALFGDGHLALVQLAVPNREYWTLNGEYSTHWVWTINGMDGLDTSYPYSWITGAPDYFARDSPFLNLTAVNATRASMQDQFEDFTMYLAPGSAQYVPLGHFSWGMDGNVTIPSTGNWADFGSGPAGTVTPSGTQFFLKTNGFPMWTRIADPGAGYIQQ